MAQNVMHRDTLFLVMEHLGIKDGLSCMMTCKEWFQLDRFEMVWKTLLSNWLLFKIHNYEQLVESYAKTKKSVHSKIYKTLSENIRKFYNLQILNEKKVNKRSFMEYMEKDMDERSVIFGSRFKKLIPLALNTNFSIMMSKGLEEMTKDFQDGIVNYSHTGVVAQYFLSNAKKFTQDGRVMEGLRAQEYWTRFSKSLLNLIISNLPTEDLTIEFINNFKPILDASTLTAYICRYRTSEKPLKFIKEYISIDGNVDKSSDPTRMKPQSTQYLATDSLLGVECWFDCMEILFPGMSEKIFDCSLIQNGYCNRLSYFKVYPTFENVKKYCEIVRVKKIDFLRDNVKNYLLRIRDYYINYQLINEMYDHGMIDTDDIKKILHTYTSLQHANPIELIRMLKDFDPYELYWLCSSTFPYNTNAHFVISFFENNYICSFFTYFNDFYNEYGPFDLEKLILIAGNVLGKDLEYYKKKIQNYLIYRLHYYPVFGMSDFLDSLKLAGKCFKQHILDIAIIEEICIFIMRNYEEEIYSDLLLALPHIPVSVGLSFEEYCQSFYTKYHDYGATLDFTNFEPNSEERMAALYHCFRALKKQENKDN